VCFLCREEAEIVTYISRVETISCTEAVLLGIHSPPLYHQASHEE